MKTKLTTFKKERTAEEMHQAVRPVKEKPHKFNLRVYNDQKKIIDRYIFALQREMPETRITPVDIARASIEMVEILDKRHREANGSVVDVSKESLEMLADIIRRHSLKGQRIR